MSRQIVPALCAAAAMASTVSAHPGAAWPARPYNGGNQWTAAQWEAEADKYPLLECKVGRSKVLYDQGSQQAAATFTASWNYLQQDCTLLDAMYNDLLTACPLSQKCPRKGYLATLDQMYKEAQTGCFSGCLGM